MAETVTRAADFIASEGVDTHISYTDGAYANISTIIADLQYLGIDRIRDGITVAPGTFGTPTLAAYETIAQAGIRFVFDIGGGQSITATGGDAADPSLDQRIGYIDQIAQAVPGSVIAVEGVNEINNAPITYDGLGTSGTGADELDAAVALQTDLDAMVHADSTLAGVSVYYFTGYAAGTIPAGPDPATTAGLADADTQHPYPNGGTAPAFWLARQQALGNETPADAANQAPVVYTETGYSSNGGTGGAVDANVQAKYTLDLLLDAQQDGVTATYLYELLDAYVPGSTQGDAGFGLFDYLGNAKPAAVDIHDMNAILADTGADAASFTSSVLAYTVTGASATSNNLELAKSDGSHIIAVWDEQPLWDESSGTEIVPVSYNETISLGDGQQSFAVSVYDPTIGVSPVEVIAATSSVTLAVSDHPVFLEVADVACFRAGTRIATQHGDIPVERLRVGDRVRRGGGGFRSVTWLGTRHIDCRRQARPVEVWPVQVIAGAFGAGLPVADLWLSPDHAIFVDGVLIPVRHLVNGVSIVRHAVDEVTYWHVELDRHDVLLAEGLPCESFLDTGNRGSFERAPFARGRVPDAPLPDAARAWAQDACAVLVEDGPVLAAVRERLLGYAAARGLRPPRTQTLRLLQAGRAHATVDGATEIVRLVSPSGRRDADRRRLGALIRGIRLDGMAVAVDDARLGAGFHAIEMHGAQAVRWTDGAADFVIGRGLAGRWIEIDVADATTAP